MATPQHIEALPAISEAGIENASAILLVWGNLDVTAKQEMLPHIVREMVHSACVGLSPERAIDFATVLYEESANMTSFAAAERKKQQPVEYRPEYDS